MLGGQPDASPHTHDDRPYEWVGAWSQRRARLTPNRVAVEEPADNAAYTYADLDERANRTARALRGLGVGSGDRVAVLSRNRVELVDLFFATAKTGGLLAPLSHRLAERDLAAVVADIEPSVVVVETPFEAELIDALDLSDADPTVRSLPTDDDHRYDPLGIDRYDPTFDAVETALSDPHLLLHTGGSTGTPKETVLTHGSIYWNAFSTITSWGIRPDDVTPLVFPMFHTGGWNILTLPFFGMGARVLLRREAHPERVLADIEREAATVLVGTPTALAEMARHDVWAATDLSSLRFVKSGGGPSREPVIEAWRERGVDFSQGYGLTEFGPNNFAMPEDAPPEKVGSVGVPAMCVDFRLVGEAGDPVARDEVGELELAGPAAAAGYWGDADERTFNGWVSTGDLARVDSDGYVHIEGRIDDMFVTAGENVYPQRVESAIVEHPDVEAAVVFGIPHDRLGAVPKAVVVADDSLTLADLESFLEPRVADFAVPVALTVVDSLPDSGTGKIDRVAVKERFGPTGGG
ncbi:AMP-binding protein [Natronomonas halophila]|uniref:class I adenylate-forming enzyme family protein n=1 Tax=Natronomonas halophila TaxID=2747817 RepID=UPI0015B47603|nr:AMP-binding protein [Natronomonas halophila]QLD86126.1 AMP-binding protein [Natronomonas halophila]